MSLIYLWYANSAGRCATSTGGSNEAHASRFFQTCSFRPGSPRAAPGVFAPAIAQDKPLRIGIIAPRSGAAGTAGECGIRAVQWAAERMNKQGGIAGRKFELVIEEETNPKDTIERLRRLVLQEKVDAIHGLISTGVSLGVAPVAEEEQALVVMWDGTTQDGVKETMSNPKYVFRSTDNECEAVMGSLLAIKHFKGKFKTGRRHQSRLFLWSQ